MTSENRRILEARPRVEPHTGAVRKSYLDSLAGRNIQSDKLVGNTVERIYIGRITHSEEQCHDGRCTQHATESHTHGRRPGGSRSCRYPLRDFCRSETLELGPVHLGRLEDEANLVEFVHMLRGSVKPVCHAALLLFRAVTLEEFQYVGRFHRNSSFLYVLSASAQTTYGALPADRLLSHFFRSLDIYILHKSNNRTTRSEHFVQINIFTKLLRFFMIKSDSKAPPARFFFTARTRRTYRD